MKSVHLLMRALKTRSEDVGWLFDASYCACIQSAYFGTVVPNQRGDEWYAGQYGQCAGACSDGLLHNATQQCSLTCACLSSQGRW